MGSEMCIRDRHRTLKERIMARSSSPDWMAHLPWVLLGIRASVREDSDTSPAELLYGTVLRLPGQLLPGVASDAPPLSSDFVRDLREKMSKSVRMPVLYHGPQRSHLPADLLSAKQVFVRVDAVRPPLSRPYEGPFAVLSRSPDSKTFTVDRNGRSWVVSVDRLKPAFSFSSTVGDSASLESSATDSLLESSDDRPPAPPPTDLAPPPAPPPLDPAPPAQDIGPLPAVAPAPPLLPVVPPVGAAPAPVPAPAPFPSVFTRSGRASKPPDRYQA